MSDLRIDDIFLTQHATAVRMDELWATGWRHQGTLFFRYSHWPTAGIEHQIMPVRLDLARFTPSKSQRRVLRKNEDLRWEIAPVEYCDEMHVISRNTAAGSTRTSRNRFSISWVMPRRRYPVSA